MTFKNAAACMIAFTLAACTQKSATEVSAAISSKPCCVALSRMSFKTLATGEREKFSISYESPLVVVDGVKGFAEGFVLPQGTQTLLVQSSYGEYLPTATFVDPSIVLLDSSHQEIARASSLNFHQERERYLLAFMDYYFIASVQVPNDARYVIVQALPISQRTITTYSANSRRWDIPASATGTLSLTPI